MQNLLYGKALEKWHPSIYNLLWLAMTNVVESKDSLLMQIKRRKQAMGLFKDYVSQTRKPEGFLGKMMMNGMNGGC